MSADHKPLNVSPDLVRGLRSIAARTIQGSEARAKLGELLQAALKLEFATIPPYLSAAYSLKNGENEAIRKLIMRIAKEEMLHLTVVANLMNAIGVTPNILAAVPSYPCNLDVIDPPLRIDLRSFSFDVVKKLFMQIETPEDPQDFPVIAALESVEDLPQTIGQFYESIIKLLTNDTIDDLFDQAEQTAYKQIQVAIRFEPVAYLNDQDVSTYPLQDGFDFVIKNKESAIKYLTWVVDEGEGESPFNPLDAEGLPGHYYRFESILHGRYLIKDESQALGYSYSGGAIPFVTSGVHEFIDNAKTEDFSNIVTVERHMKRFNSSYTELVDFLHKAFTCPSPDKEEEAKQAYNDSIGNMRAMTGKATAIIQAANNAGVKAGLPFQYIPSAPTSALPNNLS